MTVTGSGGAASTVTTTVTASGGASNQTLIQQAQAECAGVSTCLTIYSTVDATDWAADFSGLFNASFPWAAGKVNFQGLTSGQVTSEGISQYQAGKVQADLFIATLGVIEPLVSAGAIQNWSNPLIPLMNYSKGAYDPQGAWTVSFISIVGLQYNTQQISSTQASQLTWNSLANSTYKGKVGFQTATSISATAGLFYYLSTQMSNSSWTSLMNGIAANQPVITSSASTTTNNIATGQIALGIGLYNDYLEAQKSGSPIGMVFPSPAIYNPGVQSIAKNAPHPAMAQLVSEWLIGSQGQLGFAISNRTPYQTAIALQYHLVPPGIVLNNAYQNPKIFSNTAAWSDQMKSIFGA